MITLSSLLHSVYGRFVPKVVRNEVAKWRYNSLGRSNLLRYAISDHSFRQKAKRLSALEGVYSGQRCFIMGNGPSLNQMDLDAFADEYVWASNRAYLLFDRIQWRPKFWVAVDRRVVPDISEELIEVQDALPETLFFYPDTFLLTGALPTLPNTYWFPERHDPNRTPDGGFSVDASSHVASVKTVTITAIQLAVYLGFNPIYLFGCDTSYTIPETAVRGSDQAHFTSTADDDPNHFTNVYFGAGRFWHDPHPDRMLKHYEYVRNATHRLGVNIVNLTIGGALEVFPRAEYRDILSFRSDSANGTGPAAP